MLEKMIRIFKKMNEPFKHKIKLNSSMLETCNCESTPFQLKIDIISTHYKILKNISTFSKYISRCIYFNTHTHKPKILTASSKYFCTFVENVSNVIRNLILQDIYKQRFLNFMYSL